MVSHVSAFIYRTVFFFFTKVEIKKTLFYGERYKYRYLKFFFGFSFEAELSVFFKRLIW